MPLFFPLPTVGEGWGKGSMRLAPGLDRGQAPAPEQGCCGYKLPGTGSEQKSAVRWISYEKRLIARLDPRSVPGQVVLLAGVPI